MKTPVPLLLNFWWMKCPFLWVCRTNGLISGFFLWAGDKKKAPLRCRLQSNLRALDFNLHHASYPPPIHDTLHPSQSVLLIHLLHSYNLSDPSCASCASLCILVHSPWPAPCLLCILPNSHSHACSPLPAYLGTPFTPFPTRKQPFTCLLSWRFETSCQIFQ